jgi:hypothetical protein
MHDKKGVQDMTTMTDSHRIAVEKEILKRYDGMIQAADSLDAEAVFSFCLGSEKETGVHDKGITEKWQREYDSVKEQFEALQKHETRIEKRDVAVISHNVALLIAEGAYEVRAKSGETFGGPFMATNVYVLEHGEWQVLHSEYALED